MYYSRKLWLTRTTRFSFPGWYWTDRNHHQQLWMDSSRWVLNKHDWPQVNGSIGFFHSTPSLTFFGLMLFKPFLMALLNTSFWYNSCVPLFQLRTVGDYLGTFEDFLSSVFKSISSSINIGKWRRSGRTRTQNLSFFRLSFAWATRINKLVKLILKSS